MTEPLRHTAQRSDPMPYSPEYVLGDRTPAPAESIEVASGVYWLRMPLPFALDHINLWLLADGADWTLVDCGVNSPATIALWERYIGDQLHGHKIRRL